MRCHALLLGLLLPLACAGDDEATTGDSTSSTSTTSTTGEDSTSTTADTDTTGEASTSTSEPTTDGTNSTSTTDNSTSTTSDEPVCGNKIDEPGEYCDQGGVNTEACDEDCTIPKCGDGLLNEAAGEECDDNNYASEDGCSKECVAEYCGDGVVQEGLGEECEDGNDVDFDGCSAKCKVDKPCGEGFTTTWCQQAGLELDQYTRCESVSDDQATCFNPEIRYGTNEGGIPIWSGSDELTISALGEWCVSLGFAGMTAYEQGDRDCHLPYGKVVWDTGGDENAPHWRDTVNDAKWYPPAELNEADKGCDPGIVIVEVSCA